MIHTNDILKELPFTDVKFTELALEVYRFQQTHNKVYAQWTYLLGESDKNIQKIEDIPFLPIALFKNHAISAYPTHELIFTSSSTSGMGQSQHFIHKEQDYIDTFIRGFRSYFKHLHFDYLAALLPSYLDRTGSGLIHMVQYLMHREIGAGEFYNRNFQLLVEDLERLSKAGKQVLLFGVTFGLMELSKIPNSINWSCIHIIETGGMKGHGKEQVRSELYAHFRAVFPGVQIHSEYGMTELTSQAYATENGWFTCPPWMKIAIQDPADPKAFLGPGQTGRLCVIDLMNYHSCAFIATDDLGRLNDTGQFEVLGRLDYADIRGCNQLL